MVMYGVLHGSYGIIWLIKHFAMPDPSWEVKLTVPSALVVWGAVLGPYCVPAYLLASGACQEPSLARIAVGSLFYIFGVILMLAADAQKFFTLKYINFHRDPKQPRKPFLITDGFASYTRNPNYLGEMMLYYGFFSLADHWFGYAVCACVWVGVFSVRMAMKDASLRQKPGWADYAERSWILLPKIYSNSIISVVFYLALAWAAF